MKKFKKEIKALQEVLRETNRSQITLLVTNKVNFIRRDNTGILGKKINLLILKIVKEELISRFGKHYAQIIFDNAYSTPIYERKQKKTKHKKTNTIAKTQNQNIVNFEDILKEELNNEL